MASPAPPPVADLLADLATWIDVPPDLPALLALLPGADLYLQDEVQAALHPTLTRVWSPRGRRGQRLVEAPGQQRQGDRLRRAGLAGRLLPRPDRPRPPRRSRWSTSSSALVARSRARGRAAHGRCYDNLRIHTPAGSLVLRAFLAAHPDDVVLVYTPAYDPDANRIEWLWRATRRAVTHAHQRTAIADLTTDLTDHFADLAAHPADVLRHVGSPHAPRPDPRRPPGTGRMTHTPRGSI